MKVLHLSTHEREGGAARAADRLHQGLVAQGVDSQMLVQVQSSDSPRVTGPGGKAGRGAAFLRPSLDLIPQTLFSAKSKIHFSYAWFPDGLPGRLALLAPDLVHLHWINKGFVRIESLPRFQKPLVWTMHDMWAFTGGCHHSGECCRYEARCGGCPLLGSDQERDLTRWVWERKQRAWQDTPLTLVAPSEWLAGRARSSSLFTGRRVEVIANGINLDRYHPIDRNLARSWLGLPPEKRLVLFSAIRPADNPYKGFHSLPEIFQRLAAQGWGEEVELLLLGTEDERLLADLPFRKRCLGRLGDDTALALVYAAADLFLAPSLYDTFPSTVMEALACGTPCVAFGVGGIPEMIDHRMSGYLADPGEIEDFAHGIDWLLREDSLRATAGQAARARAERDFNLVNQAQRYLELYREILEPGRENPDA